MPTTTLSPFTDIPVPLLVAALPKADLHLHQEERPRLDRIVARELGRRAFDWQGWLPELITETPAGMARLRALFAPDGALPLDDIAADDPELVIAKFADLLEEGAADGATLIEVRCGASAGGIGHPEFMALFREAERRVQARYPRLRAEAISFVLVSDDTAQHGLWEHCFEVSLRAARRACILRLAPLGA